MSDTRVIVRHPGSEFDGLTGVLVEVDRRGNGVSVRLDTLPAGMFGHVRMFGAGQVGYLVERQIVQR